MDCCCVSSIIGLVTLEYYYLYYVKYRKHYGPLGQLIKDVYIRFKYRKLV